MVFGSSNVLPFLVASVREAVERKRLPISGKRWLAACSAARQSHDFSEGWSYRVIVCPQSQRSRERDLA